MCTHVAATSTSWLWLHHWRKWPREDSSRSGKRPTKRRHLMEWSQCLLFCWPLRDEGKTAPLLHGSYRSLWLPCCPWVMTSSLAISEHPVMSSSCPKSHRLPTGHGVCPSIPSVPLVPLLTSFVGPHSMTLCVCPSSLNTPPPPDLCERHPWFTA